jgi:protein-tyrosine phosphatase
MIFNARRLHSAFVALMMIWPGFSSSTYARSPLDTPLTAIPFDTATVSDDGGNHRVSWDAVQVRTVRIFATTDPDLVDPNRSVGRGGKSGQVLVSGIPPAVRWYFQLVPDRGEPLTIADRSLHLSTAANFRDAGGYRTQEGRWVRMGLVYRSNGIEHLTDQELAKIDQLHIRLVCDLRTAEEIHRGPDRVPAGASTMSADVLADDAELIRSMTGGGGQGSGKTNGSSPTTSGEETEQRIYRDFVRLPSAQKGYRALFERLADPDQLPTIFHCTAGKDRTGWAQAVFLTILGVPRETIIKDYLLTNTYLRGAAMSSVRQSLSSSAPKAVVANEASLAAAFDQVTKQYGSFDRYIHEGLQLDDAILAAIRKNFLVG